MPYRIHRRQRACVPASIIAFGLFCGTPSSAQVPARSQASAPESEHAIRVEVDLQSLEVQVKDGQGDDVPGLSAKDFTILEDGKPQEIAFFDAGNDPASMVVLVDSSGSVSANGRLGSAQSIAAQFMRTARPGDEISAMDFTDRMGPFQTLTREQLLNPSSVSLAPAGGAGSALYDAIASALCHLRASKNLQQAVVVITDGVDQQSRVTLDQLTDLVRSSRAQLFMIDLESKPEFNFRGHPDPKMTLVSGHDIDNPVVVFNRLTKDSGADSSLAKSERNLEQALKAVSDTLRAQYTVAYYPRDSAKKLRKIEVKVDRKGVRALTRRVIGSSEDAADAIHFNETTCTVSPKFHPYPYDSKVTHAHGTVYREDFADPHSGWPERENSHYLKGAYEISNPAAQSGPPSTRSRVQPGDSIQTTFQQSVVAAYGPWWGDFRASVMVNPALAPQTPGANAAFQYFVHPAAGLVFRMNQYGYYALFLSGARGKKEVSIKLVKREFQGDSYTETEIVSWTKVPARGLPSGTEIAVEDIGDQISMFVDGEKVKSEEDDSFGQGYAGFVVSGPGRATFRNFAVEAK